jgi:cytidine deaminase
MNYRHTIEYQLFDFRDELTASDQELIDKAQEAMVNAYAPYSRFTVGASVKLKNGIVLIGSNQENIAYPSGLCAERVALFYAGAAYPDQEVETLCIIARGDLIPESQLLSPCGSCRQVMCETEMRQGNPFRVILVNQDGRILIFESAHDLLPLAFGKL